jgi:hypothetical protein
MLQPLEQFNEDEVFGLKGNTFSIYRMQRRNLDKNIFVSDPEFVRDSNNFFRDKEEFEQNYSFSMGQEFSSPIPTGQMPAWVP